MFPREGSWASLPTVYLARDQGNPWFEAINAKQLRLLKSTYDSTVSTVHVVAPIKWT